MYHLFSTISVQKHSINSATTVLFLVTTAAPPTTTTATTKSPTTKAKTTQVPSSFCIGKKDGNYIDPSRCDGFISCVANKVHKMDCPHGLWYNVKTDRCDWPKNVNCTRKSTQ